MCQIGAFIVVMSVCLALSKALSMLIPKCAELIHTDEERTVVMTALDAYSELLKEVKGAVLEGEGHRDAIINCVKDVMSCKVLISVPFFQTSTNCEMKLSVFLIMYNA